MGSYKNKLFLSKYSSNLETIWDYEWYDHTGLKYSCIKDILFIDENNVVISGVKDYFKIYIAKFNTTILEVNDYNNSIKINLYPNPVSDCLEISYPLSQEGAGVVAIFDILGIEHTTPSLRDTQPYQGGEIVRIDVSHLSPGVYFVRVGDVVRKLMKM